MPEAASLDETRHGRKRIATEMTEEGAMKVSLLAKAALGPIKLFVAAGKLGYASSRGVAKLISVAYGWFISHAQGEKAAEIARTFVDRNGKYPWAHGHKLS